MSKALSEMFKGEPQFKIEIALDKYLTDVDIKEFLEMYLGTSGRSLFLRDMMQACYLNNRKKENCLFGIKSRGILTGGLERSALPEQLGERDYI